MYQHVLIPTDGSEVAQKGIVSGLELAKALGARVTFVTATELLPIFADASGLGSVAFDVSQYFEAQEENAAQVLKAAKASADQAGVTAEVLHVSRAQPAETILETANVRGCDLIVMASHGRRGVGRLLLGSQASEVVTRSPIPVLVIK
jgi:nucleotide-binding universal stress UspA family protein